MKVLYVFPLILIFTSLSCKKDEIAAPARAEVLFGRADGFKYADTALFNQNSIYELVWDKETKKCILSLETGQDFYQTNGNMRSWIEINDIKKKKQLFNDHEVQITRANFSRYNGCLFQARSEEGFSITLIENKDNTISGSFEGFIATSETGCYSTSIPIRGNFSNVSLTISE